MLEWFIALFVVVDPIGIAPLFLAVTASHPVPGRRRTALRGALLSLVILLAFFLAGEALIDAVGISIDAFRIAGGSLLFLLAVDMVFARHSGIRSTTEEERDEAARREDVSVFPLAFPLIAGPGAMTTVLLMRAAANGTEELLAMAAVVTAVIALTLLSMLAAARVVALLGETGTNVITRLLGVVLAALAVQYALDGIHGALG